MLAGKLKVGDHVRIIAPARSLAILSEEVKANAVSQLEALGLKVTFSKNAMICDEFISSSVEERIEDIHEGFKDEQVKAILTVIGGFNSNQLLDQLDYELIAANPKILCGFSDITALANTVYKKTGLITYSGPHFSSFGMEKGFEYTLDYFKKCLMNEAPYKVEPAESWSDDAWFLDQKNRIFEKQEDFLVVNEGKCEGTIIGGNLCTFNLLQGTDYFPSLEGKVLFLEDDDLSDPVTFDRDLQSLMHQNGFYKVKGIVIGRFQKNFGMSMDKLKKIIISKKDLNEIPIVANVNFGHTTPIITFPIGGNVKLTASNNSVEILISEH